MVKYEDKRLCSECGGTCCKSMGCHFSPDDFNEVTYELLKSKIEDGHVSIDWWEGDPTDNNVLEKAYILRMRNISAPVVDPSYGGVCSVLTSSGCPLPFESRPKGGRTLIPKQDGCILEYTKKQCAIDWLPYSDILEKLYHEYKPSFGNEDVLKIFLSQFSK